jgi:hypothetical protein
MTKTIVPTVPAFAFIVPVYDYDNIDDLSPAVDGDCVGYMAFGWNVKGQCWKKLSRLHDIPAEARAVAEAHHLKLRKELGVAEHVKSPEFDIPQEEIDAEAEFA